MTTDLAQSSTTARRRWLRFSLRSLMLFMTVLAVVAALIAHRFEEAGRQREAGRQLHQYFGAAYYDYQVDETGQYLGKVATPPGPEWLRSLVGIDFLSRVTMVQFWEENSPGTDAYALFRDLPRLETLIFFDTSFRGEGVAHLAKLPRLRRLILNRSVFGEENVKPLGQLKRLEELSLIEGAFHADHLLSLRSLKNLRRLDLRRVNAGWKSKYPRISHRTIEQLQAAVPKCKIIYDADST